MLTIKSEAGSCDPIRADIPIQVHDRGAVMTRQQQAEIRSYAEKLGLEVVRFEKRSKHDAAILSNGKRSRFITLSATPSDFRTGYAVQRDIRKVARELREPVSYTHL